MTCPKCMQAQFVTTVNDTHYICVKDPLLLKEETGCGTQFKVIEDAYVRFPYNMMFSNRNRYEFFKKEYLQISPVGKLEK